VVPEFASDEGEPTDFNDLYVNEGAEKVREAFSLENIGKNEPNTSFSITKEKKETVPDNSEDDSEITDEHLPDGFRLSASALYYIDKRSGPIYLCAYLRVISKTVNIDSNESGKLLEFRTIHGEIKKICMRSKDLFAGHTQTILKDLAGAGLHINLEAPTRKILVYLNNYSPARSIKTTRKSGWCANGFLTENGIITIEEREEDILLDTAYGSTCVSVSGSGNDWRENIGRLCCGNSRLILAASTAFTAPLLHLLDRPNFGIQLVGKSSAGKTTALYVAASVYGPRGYVKSWRATDNGLETVAFNHNDMLLILDEMGEMSPQKIGATVYMLANGVGKTRANTSGDAKQPKTWRIALLSAGEIDLNTHMASVGSAAMAGQNIRLLPVPAVPKDMIGLIENTHGFNTASAMVKHLITATQRCYGAPLLEYIRLLMRNQEKIIDDFNNGLEEKKAEIVPSHADGQNNRVFDFFFTVGFAGELATQYGLTGWREGEALSVAIAIFKDWVVAKGGFGNQEEKMLL
jgi:putative DNA primase/helicase